MSVSNAGIFEAESFRAYVRQRIERLPRRGRGELGRLSRHLRLHTTSLSQILHGTRQLSQEHAILLCGHFGLSDLETRYFLLLVQWEQTGSEELRRLLRLQMDELREARRDLSRVIAHGTVLTEEQRAVFYSSWFYSAVRVLSSIPGHQTPESIATHLGLPLKLVSQVAEFLVHTGLCVLGPQGLAPGPSYTHLEASSPLIARHHANWRIKAMERHPKQGKDELSYSSAMSVSAADAERIRELLLKAVSSVNRIREASACEAAYFMNLDWLKL